MKKKIITILVLTISGCVSTPKDPQRSMSAEYHQIKENTFQLKAIAPFPILREYAICKAIKFAEIKDVKEAAIAPPTEWGKSQEVLPKGWGEFNTTVYLSKPKATTNPFLNVKKLASICRKNWEWYR